MLKLRMLEGAVQRLFMVFMNTFKDFMCESKVKASSRRERELIGQSLREASAQGTFDKQLLSLETDSPI